MGLWNRLYPVIFHPEERYNWPINTLLHGTGIAWSLLTTRLEGQGPAPKLHSDTSSSARHSGWRLRSTDASYARRKSRPKINSIVILVTNTQIFNWRHPRASIRKTSFKMGWLPQILSAVCNVGSAVFLAIHWDDESYARPFVDGHKAWLVTDPTLCY
jgi:hypothetical protein